MIKRNEKSEVCKIRSITRDEGIILKAARDDVSVIFFTTVQCNVNLFQMRAHYSP